jgi:pyruvate dehydrogenase E1 component alpha subunit
MQGALERARSGLGPTFLEAVTYRMGAHSTSDDPSRYRSQEEVDAWGRRDPLDRLRKHLQYLGLVTDETDASLDQEIAAEIGAAIDAVEAMPPPERSSLMEDVYAELPWNLREQLAELRKFARE